jgi:hypothetical protein
MKQRANSLKKVKIDKSLAKLTKQKREKEYQCRTETKSVSADSRDIKR